MPSSVVPAGPSRPSSLPYSTVTDLEVARLVDVGAARDGDVIGEQLEG